MTKFSKNVDISSHSAIFILKEQIPLQRHHISMFVLFKNSEWIGEFLGAFAKLRKVTISFVMFVCRSVHSVSVCVLQELNNSAPLWRFLMRFDIVFFENLWIKSRFKIWQVVVCLLTFYEFIYWPINEFQRGSSMFLLFPTKRLRPNRQIPCLVTSKPSWFFSFGWVQQYQLVIFSRAFQMPCSYDWAHFRP